jgi:hypothetical protein
VAPGSIGRVGLDAEGAITQVSSTADTGILCG